MTRPSSHYHDSHKFTVETIERHTVKLTGSDIITMMEAVDYVFPIDRKVEFHVPESSGDWPGEVLDINEHPITVTWEHRTVGGSCDD